MEPLDESKHYNSVEIIRELNKLKKELCLLSANAKKDGEANTSANQTQQSDATDAL